MGLPETMGSAANDPLWITEAEVASLVDMGEAIAALERGLALEAEGKAENMVKTHAIWGGGHTLHAVGALFPESGFVGTKTWAHTEGGATPLLILFDSHDGALEAVIEAFALGQLRTGGISGVATRWLARADADDMALIGTGKQAITQLAAVAAVRPLRRLRVFSPHAERRAAFIKRVRAELDLPAEEAESVAAAVAGASIVTLVTRARTPFLTSAMLARGAHVNAVGAITPERMEFEPALVARAGVIAADSVPQVRNLSREFQEAFGSDEAQWGRMKPISAIVAARQPRPKDADITIFKAMGMGISDLSLGIEIYRRARAKGLGRAIPHPQRAKPRLKAAAPAMQGD
jgi:ornithine cyclodeaminase